MATAVQQPTPVPTRAADAGPSTYVQVPESKHECMLTLKHIQNPTYWINELTYDNSGLGRSRYS